MDYERIGERVRENRILMRMTQEQLAEKIDRTVHYVSQIENARRKPSLETIVNISNALKVPLDSLIQDSSELAEQVEMLEIKKILYGKSKSELKAIVDVLRVLSQYIKL